MEVQLASTEGLPTPEVELLAALKQKREQNKRESARLVCLACHLFLVVVAIGIASVVVRRPPVAAFASMHHFIIHRTDDRRALTESSRRP